MVLFLKSMDQIVTRDHSNSASEQYIPLILFDKLYKVVPASVDEILACYYSNESYRAVVPSCGAVCLVLQGGSLRMKPKTVTNQMEATDQCFPVVMFIMYNVVLCMKFRLSLLLRDSRYIKKTLS